MITRDEMENLIRDRLGNIASSLSSNTLQMSIDSALDDLARVRPKIVYELIEFVPNQSTYVLPDGVYNVLDVVFPSLSSQAYSDFTNDWFTEIALSDYGDISTFHNHSLAHIVEENWENFENRFGYDWEYDIDANAIIVMPQPNGNGKMLVKTGYRRELEEVPARLMRAVQDLALSDTMNSIITGMGGGGIMSLPIGIGAVSFNTNSLASQAKKLRDDALRKIGGSSGGGAVIVG